MVTLQKLALQMAFSGVEQEMQCVIHWFSQWSDVQKSDFLKDLVNKAVPHKVANLFDAMDGLNMADKPPSIFKCQMKLFDQWFVGWTDKERNGFMRQLEVIDPNFVSQFEEQISESSGQP
eukprot:GHVU01200542.1.p1 GENE.GHVU01200542.1~~GHVU01200542.1.p1  ORF type:complete len:120 (+),score=16.23 GHVU01200542.1:68-427(+)